MIDASEAKENVVVDTFEFDGKPAQVVWLRNSENTNQADLAQHATNLAETNFQLLPEVLYAKERAVIRELMFKARGKLARLPVIGETISSSKVFDQLLSRVYPDYTKQEHFEACKNRSFPKLMGDNQLVGIESEERLLSVQAYRQVGETQSGRPVFIFTKASTLNDPKYRGKRLNPRLKKTIFDVVMKKYPEALWAGATVNKKHLDKFVERGWHTVEIDDPHEAIQAMHRKDPSYVAILKAQGYKAVHFDPKVDHVTWD